MNILKYVQINCNNLARIDSQGNSHINTSNNNNNNNNNNNSAALLTTWLEQVSKIKSVKHLYVPCFCNPIDIVQVTSKCNHTQSLVCNVIGPKFEDVKGVSVHATDHLRYRQSIPITTLTYGILVGATNSYFRQAIKQLKNVENIFCMKAINKSKNISSKSFACMLRPNSIKLMSIWCQKLKICEIYVGEFKIGKCTMKSCINLFKMCKYLNTLFVYYETKKDSKDTKETKKCELKRKNMIIHEFKQVGVQHIGQRNIDFARFRIACVRLKR